MPGSKDRPKGRHSKGRSRREEHVRRSRLLSVSSSVLPSLNQYKADLSNRQDRCSSALHSKNQHSKNQHSKDQCSKNRLSKSLRSSGHSRLDQRSNGLFNRGRYSRGSRLRLARQDRSSQNVRLRSK